MKGNAVYQVDKLWRESGINQIGRSRHKAKEEARAGRTTLRGVRIDAPAKTAHEISKATGVHSYATADAYRDVWRQCFNYCKEHYGLKDFEKMKPEHAESFLLAKIENGCKRATFGQYASALEKLGTALTMYSAQTGRNRVYDLSPGIEEARVIGREIAPSEPSRAYAKPQQLVEAMTAEHRLAAAIQYSGGARLDELQTIHLDKLAGDEVTVRGKGGKVRTIQLRYGVEKQLIEFAAQGHQRLVVDPDEYRDSIKAAALATGQSYNGSHGLRWNYAQERMVSIQKDGTPYESALGIVSNEMGHNRPDITQHYLR